MQQIGLTREGCQARQKRLRDALAAADLDAAIITQAVHVHYLAGVWPNINVPAALLIERDGPATLCAAGTDWDQAAADQVISYPAAHLGTLVDGLDQQVIVPLTRRLKRSSRVGCDQGGRPWLMADWQVADLSPTLRSLQRRKDPDELAMIQHAIAGCEAGYAAVRQQLRPGLTEIEVYAMLLAAATQAVGEPIGPMGNDFQSGQPGGTPRRRAIEAGELMPLDVSVIVRGYRCDLCRTFAVGRQADELQREAHQRVMEAIAWVERNARAGTRCGDLYQHVHAMLSGHHGWRFTHHLGHGIGLFAHEAPRLNPHWDDVLEPGDVFTVEPGLYHPSLRGGVRLEQNYFVPPASGQVPHSDLTPGGLQRLSRFPLDL